MKHLLCAFVVLQGCAEGPGHVTIRVYDETAQHGSGELLELPPEILEACDLLGLTCEVAPRDTPRGSLQLHLIGEGHPGRTVVMTRCLRAAVVRKGDAAIVAHEMVHLLTRDEAHSSDVLNLMAPTVVETELTMQQWDDIQRGADQLERCVGNE